MRQKIVLISVVLTLLSSPGRAQTWQQTINELITQTLPHANVGVVILDPQSGEHLYEHNGDKLLSPASNTKLLTAAAALYHLGATYRYSTTLSQLDNHFYITFSGSPSFTSENLKLLLQPLNTLGIKIIKGDIVLDTTQYQPPYYASAISYDDLGWYYSAPSTAVILNENAVTYDVISATKLGMPIQLKSQSPESPLNIINDIKTVNKEQARDHCNFNIDLKPNNTLHLYGCLAQDEHPIKMQFAIPNPVLFAKQLIRKTLEENHVHLNGKIIEGKKPPQARILATNQSDELSKLLAHMLQESDNLYADSITKRLGYSLTGQGTYKQGVYAIKHILEEHTHLDMKQVALTDGEGGRYNLITPNQLVMLLKDLYEDNKIKPLFLSLLPRMGLSGTLKDRMKKSSLENRVLAKTGTMHDISSLSGYLVMPSGKTLIFSIISNGLNGNLSEAKVLEEKILLEVLKSEPQKNPRE